MKMDAQYFGLETRQGKITADGKIWRETPLNVMEIEGLAREISIQRGGPDLNLWERIALRKIACPQIDLLPAGVRHLWREKTQ